MNLLIRASAGDEHVRVELWAGGIDTTAGLAVTIARDRLAAIYRIPMCGCGVRGCGNAGLQLATDVAAADLPVLIDAVVGLPIAPVRPQPSAVWKGTMSPEGPIV